MNFKNLIYILSILVLVYSCSSNSNDDLTEQEAEPVLTTEVTYDADIKAIISNNCIQCHGSPTSNGAPTSYVTYTQVKNSVNTILSRINNATNPMPQSGLMPIKNRQLIQQWKDDGLLEN